MTTDELQAKIEDLQKENEDLKTRQHTFKSLLKWSDQELDIETDSAINTKRMLWTLIEATQTMTPANLQYFVEALQRDWSVNNYNQREKRRIDELEETQEKPRLDYGELTDFVPNGYEKPADYDFTDNYKGDVNND